MAQSLFAVLMTSCTLDGGDGTCLTREEIGGSFFQCLDRVTVCVSVVVVVCDSLNQSYVTGHSCFSCFELVFFDRYRFNAAFFAIITFTHIPPIH